MGECNAHKKEFNDMGKKSKIYTHDRRSSVADAIAESKKLPGVGKYETTAFDEKRCRPPKGSYGNKDQRVLNTDVVIHASKQVPFHINDSNPDKYMTRAKQIVKLFPETEIQKEV